LKYFAYGSNMDPERMRRRGIRFSRREHAVLEGFRLEFNKVSSRNPREGYANIVKDPESVVEGILYEIKESDLRKLDRREGYPSHYRRTRVYLKLDNGERVEAITYIAQPEKVESGLRPSKEYLSHLLRGCDLLSEEYCEKLRRTPTLQSLKR